MDVDRRLIRAMPTRQLHITAGNAVEVPLISALRAILTKSAAVIKTPFGATLTGALLALASVKAAPSHPITQNMSVVYWQGGDDAIEKVLFKPGAFDRVVAWGDPATVVSVQSRAAFTRTVYFNPRFGVSFIGQEAFTGNLADVVSKAAADSLIYNQQSCVSSLVHYVEGTAEQVELYARQLCAVFGILDSAGPLFVPPSTIGQLKRLRRGRYSSARWFLNMRGEIPVSGVAVIDDEFDILDHPLNRLVVVRPVGNLADALRYLHQGVSSVGVYPEEKRTVMRDTILARGVSSVLPLGGRGCAYAGMPHDGMLVLNQLVDWKNA